MIRSPSVRAPCDLELQACQSRLGLTSEVSIVWRMVNELWRKRPSPREMGRRRSIYHHRLGRGRKRHPAAIQRHPAPRSGLLRRHAIIGNWRLLIYAAHRHSRNPHALCGLMPESGWCLV